MANKKLKTNKSRVTPRRGLSKWALIPTLLVVILAGFIVYNTLASSSTIIIYPNKANHTVINGYGKFVTDYFNYKVWQDKQHTGYSWWGKTKYDQGKGRYTACWTYKKVGTEEANLYMDVTRKAGSSRKLIASSTQTVGNGAPIDGPYSIRCLSYTLNSKAYDLEWRADVKSGTINLARVVITKI